MKLKYVLPVILSMIMTQTPLNASSLSFKLYPIYSIWNLTYSFSNISQTSHYPSQPGIGLEISYNVLKNLDATIAYEGYTGASPEAFNETIGISALKLGGKYVVELNKTSLLFFSAGINYSFWKIDDQVFFNSPTGQLGYQIAIGYEWNQISIESGYQIFKAVEEDKFLVTAPTIPYSITGQENLHIETPSFFIKATYTF